MKKYIIFLVIVFFIIFVVSINPPRLVEEGVGGGNTVKIGGQTIEVDVADTPAEQAQGLSGREGLAEDEGMLFIFDKPGIHGFWMKDMKFTIDIIWLDEDMRIVYIKENARPELYPETYGPDDGTSMYVLEVVSGFSQMNNLKVGDRMELIK